MSLRRWFQFQPLTDTAAKYHGAVDKALVFPSYDCQKNAWVHDWRINLPWVLLLVVEDEDCVIGQAARFDVWDDWCLDNKKGLKAVLIAQIIRSQLQLLFSEQVSQFHLPNEGSCFDRTGFCNSLIYVKSSRKVDRAWWSESKSFDTTQLSRSQWELTISLKGHKAEFKYFIFKGPSRKQFIRMILGVTRTLQ